MSSLALTTEAFAAGEPVLVAGLDGREAAVALAASRVNEPRLEALHELGGDMLVLGLDPDISERLGVAAPRGTARRRAGVRLATPVDAADCRGGGWSLTDRAHTIRVAADPETRPTDLTAPGHVHLGTAYDDSSSASSIAVALELARCAEQPGAVLVSAALDRAGRAVSLSTALHADRLRHLPSAPVEELCGLVVSHRAAVSSDTCALPTRLGAFRALATSTTDGGEVTVTLVHGDPAGSAEPLIHTHVACLLGDTFGSLLCDCHARLEGAAAEIVAHGSGMIIYVKPAAEDPFRCPRASVG